MAFSKIRHNEGAIKFKLFIEEGNGATIEKWVVMKEDFPKLVDIISKKYSLNIKKKNRDLDWLK